MNLYVNDAAEKRKKIIKEVANYVIVILLGIVLAFVVVYFGFHTSTMIGQSMEPTIANNQTMLVKKCAYSFSSPKRFDIIVFNKTRSDETHTYVKRIVGLPNDKLKIENGEIFVNNKRLKDSPITDLITNPGSATEEITLNEDEYFVMGDNCNNSEDSRFANVGIVKTEDIEGKIVGTFKGKKYSKIK